jgi:phosphonate transport system permease protein
LGASGGFEWQRYHDAAGTIRQLMVDSVPPDFSRIGTWVRPWTETICMSAAATLVGSVCALPLGLIAARTTGLPRGVSVVARLVLNVARSVPELVLGVVFVASVGFGPLAGVLALACHSVGMLGKFVSEHIEHLNQAPGDALKAQGVSRFGIMRFCLLPQVLPRLLDIALYRWEHNVRAASVMGMVGAGGLGRELVAAFSLFEYREALAILLVMLATVTVIDCLSGYVRTRMLR